MADAPVVVVGAGIAGAACAHSLAAAGIPTVVLDRGHRVGGRLAARTLRETGTPYDGHVVDVGASYLTAHDPGFRAVVDDWAERGLARGWTDTFLVAGPEGLRGTTTGPLRYAAPRGLRSLVEDLVERLPADLVEVVHPHEAERIRLADGLTYVDDIATRGVALCMPDPQARRLLDPAATGLDSTRRATEGVLWEPVLVMAAVYRERVWPEMEGCFVNEDPVITWIADDGRRRGDDAPVLVVHADPVMAAGHLDDPTSAAPAMLAATRRVLGLHVDPEWFEIKRWTHAKPVTAWPEPYHLDPDTGVGLAGDGWAAGPRVECAWISGDALGRGLAERLTA